MGVALFAETLVIKSAFAQRRTDQESARCVDLESLFEQLFSDGRGFEMGGSVKATHTVYVIFDPQCPDCIGFWNLANKFKERIRFIWMPVAILNSRSEPQGAMLLSSKSPIKLMNQQVSLFNAASRGVESNSVDPSNEAREDVWRNSRIFRRAGGKNVPFAIYQDKGNKIVGSADIGTYEALVNFLKTNTR